MKQLELFELEDKYFCQCPMCIKGYYEACMKWSH